MLRNQLTIILIILVILTLCSCNTDQGKEELHDEKIAYSKSIQWDLPTKDGLLNIDRFDISEAGYHITAAVRIINGIAKPLSRKEYLGINKLDYNGRELFLEEKLNEKNEYRFEFIPQSQRKTYAGGEIRRTTAVFQDASGVYSGFYSFTRKIVDKEDKLKDLGVQNHIDKVVHKKYGLYKTVDINPSNVNAGFSPSGKYKYAAVAFIPEIAVIQGKCNVYKDGKKEPAISCVVECNYPYTDAKRNIGGIFVLVEADKFDALPRY